MHLQDQDGWTPLHWAVYNNHTACVRILWTHKSPNLEDKKAKTPVYWAGRQKQATAAAELIELQNSSHKKEHGEEAAAVSSTGMSWTSIHRAAVKGDHILLQQLLTDSGVVPGSYSRSKAAAGDIVEVVEAIGQCGIRPLHLAAMCGTADCLGVLLSAGAGVHTADVGGKTALHRAARCGSVGALELLLKHTSQVLHMHDNDLVEAVDEDGRTALHDAAYNGHLLACQMLVQVGAPVEARELDGSTPLLLAAYSGHARVVADLVASGADIAAEDLDGG
jgi:ankyrin repeat protein